MKHLVKIPSLRLSSWLAISICLAGILFFLWLNVIPVGVPGDDSVYISLARALVSGQGYRDVQYVGSPYHMVAPPGYPLLLVPLVSIFPGNFMPMKLLSVAFTVGAGVLIYMLLREEGPADVIGATILLFLAGWQTPVHATAITSEPAYLFVSLMALLYLEKCSQKRKLLTKDMVLLIISVIASCYIRTIGISVLVVSVIYLFYREQRNKAIVLAVFAGLPLIAWFVRNQALSGSALGAYVPSTDVLLGSVVSADSNLLNALRDYLPLVSHFVILPVFGPKVDALFAGWRLGLLVPLAQLVLVGLTFLGFVAHLKRGVRGFHIYAALYVAGIVVFRGYGIFRYLWPVAPFLLLFFLYGTWWLIESRFKSSKLSTRIRPVFLAIVAVLSLLHLGRNAQGLLNAQATNLSLPYYITAGMWLRDHAEPNAVVMSRDPDRIYVYAERQGLGMPERKEDMATILSSKHVDYVVLGLPIQNSLGQITEYRQDFASLLHENPASFELVYDVPRAQVQVYRVLDQGGQASEP